MRQCFPHICLVLNTQFLAEFQVWSWSGATGSMDVWSSPDAHTRRVFAIASFSIALLSQTLMICGETLKCVLSVCGNAS